MTTLLFTWSEKERNNEKKPSNISEKKKKEFDTRNWSFLSWVPQTPNAHYTKCLHLKYATRSAALYANLENEGRNTRITTPPIINLSYHFSNHQYPNHYNNYLSKSRQSKATDPHQRKGSSKQTRKQSNWTETKEGKGKQTPNLGMTRAESSTSSRFLLEVKWTPKAYPNSQSGMSPSCSEKRIYRTMRNEPITSPVPLPVPLPVLVPVPCGALWVKRGVIHGWGSNSNLSLISAVGDVV